MRFREKEGELKKCVREITRGWKKECLRDLE